MKEEHAGWPRHGEHLISQRNCCTLGTLKYAFKSSKASCDSTSLSLSIARVSSEQRKSRVSSSALPLNRVAPKSVVYPLEICQWRRWRKEIWATYNLSNLSKLIWRPRSSPSEQILLASSATMASEPPSVKLSMKQHARGKGREYMSRCTKEKRS